MRRVYQGVMPGGIVYMPGIRVVWEALILAAGPHIE
jgi:hypothetical protein